MLELKILSDWIRARVEHARRQEDGFTAVEWLVIALGVIAIAGIAVAAVRAFVTSKGAELQSG